MFSDYGSRGRCREVIISHTQYRRWFLGANENLGEEQNSTQVLLRRFSTLFSFRDFLSSQSSDLVLSTFV